MSKTSEKCRKCGDMIACHGYGIASWEEGLGATLDCYRCGGLLLVDRIKNEAGEWEVYLEDFHRMLYESTGGAWPADGEGTGVITIEADA